MFLNNLGYTRMGRMASYPKTVEDCLKFDINALVKYNDRFYFRTYGTKNGTSKWSRNGIEHSKIGYSITHTEYHTFITLNYTYNSEPICYTVNIVSKPSNLGKGTVYFFECPETNKLCRNLYLNDGYFMHREAFGNLMYESQIMSKKTRSLWQIFNSAMPSDEVYFERYKKYFKTHYKGKPTKRYLKLQRIIDVSEQYPVDTVERLLSM